MPICNSQMYLLNSKFRCLNKCKKCIFEAEKKIEDESDQKKKQIEDEKWYSDEHSLGLLVFSPLFLEMVQWPFSFYK